MEKKAKKQQDVLLRWQAPTRPFKKRDKTYFQTAAALVFLLTVILLFLHEWLLIGVVLALFFVAYVLASVEPPKIEHKITEKGIWIGEGFYRFNELAQYWFEEHLGQKTLILFSPLKAPDRLSLVLSGISQEEVDKILREKLVFREKPLKTFVDSLSEWLKKKNPLSS